MRNFQSDPRFQTSPQQCPDGTRYPPPPPPLSPYPQFSQQAHPPQSCLFPPAPRTGTPHASAAATQAAPAYMHSNFNSMNGLGIGSVNASSNNVNGLGPGSSVGSPSPLASLSPLLRHPAFTSRWGMPITSTVAPIMSFGPPAVSPVSVTRMAMNLSDQWLF